MAPYEGRAVLAAALQAGDTKPILDALLSVTYYDPDWPWLQDTCLSLLDHRDPWVRRLAVICLGHIATFHRRLDQQLVTRRLTELQLRDEDAADLAAVIEDALGDIEAALAPSSNSPE